MDYRRHIRLVLFAFFSQGIFFLRNILMLPILGRCLGPEQFGLWGKIQIIGQIVSSMASLGTLEGMGRYIPAAESRQKLVLLTAAVAVICVSGAIVTAALAIGAGLIAPFLLTPTTAEAHAAPRLLAAIGFMAILGNLGQASTNFYLLSDRPRIYGAMMFLQIVVLLAAALGLAPWIKQSIWLPILAWSIAPAVTAALALSLSASTGMLSIPPFRPCASAAQQMISYGLPLLPSGIILAIHHGAGRYLITILRHDLGNDAVGVYTVHYALAGLIAMAFSPFFLFYQPAVARLWDSGERAAAGHLTRQTLKYAMITSLPLCAGAPAWADAGARLAAGQNFAAPWGVIFFAMLAYFLQMVGYFAEVPLQMEKRTSRIMAYYLISAAVAVVASIALISCLEGNSALIGAAAGAALGFGCNLLLHILTCRRLAPGWLDITVCFKAMLAAAAGASAARLIGMTTLSSAALALAFAAVAYLGLLFLLGVITRQEAKIFWEAMRLARRQRK